MNTAPLAFGAVAQKAYKKSAYNDLYDRHSLTLRLSGEDKALAQNVGLLDKEGKTSDITLSVVSQEGVLPTPQAKQSIDTALKDGDVGTLDALAIALPLIGKRGHVPIGYDVYSETLPSQALDPLLASALHYDQKMMKKILENRYQPALGQIKAVNTFLEKLTNQSESPTRKALRAIGLSFHVRPDQLSAIFQETLPYLKSSWEKLMHPPE